ncbi:ABC transporter permease [Nocardioides sp. GXZ039]|uniref:ABC transporter permease n=1 Tax=Nocardioides sp. GXZ039 TaxID=3136018 RepID=UPI0030F43EFC
MSTHAAERATIDVSQTAPVPFGRLVKVEWRKMIDTRSGFWLLTITAILLVFAAAISLLVVALNDGITMSAGAWSQTMSIPLQILLPAIAILTVTSEWSQRTGLVTFTLVPHRMQLIGAKAAAVFLLAVATIVLAIGLGAIGNIVAAQIGGYDATWNLTAYELFASVVVQLLFFFMAFGIGMALLNTPGAIAVYYIAALLLPIMVYSTLMAFFGWAESLIPWFDITYSTVPFLETNPDISGTDVAKLVTSVVIWVVLPIAIGTRRVLTSEPK